MEKTETTIYFAKTRKEAIIPSKRDEDAGYDIYACFDDDYIKVCPHETKMITTGIASAFSKLFYAQLQERGSTGTKGIAQRCGVIDSGYRAEWNVPITNTTEKTLYIAKKTYLEKVDAKTKKPNKEKAMFKNAIIYPYEKAICQALLLPVPKSNVVEISLTELLKISSERGSGKLGSSGK